MLKDGSITSGIKSRIIKRPQYGIINAHLVYHISKINARIYFKYNKLLSSIA